MTRERYKVRRSMLIEVMEDDPNGLTKEEEEGQANVRSLVGACEGQSQKL